DTAQTITFSITGGADQAKFSINSSTGALVFVTAPDFETPTDVGADNVYNVTVQASDGNGGTDTQDIAVTVTDVNEFTTTPPTTTSNAGGATPSTNVAENTTPATPTPATAPDVPGQTLTFSITGGADQAKFSINSSTGALVFTSAPDFENP